MEATTLASRAILAEYAKRSIRPFEITAIIIFIIMTLGAASLIAQVSVWWWILMVLVLMYGAIGSIIWLIVHHTLDRIRPTQTPEQTKAVGNFITQLNKVADTLQITKFALLLRVLKGVMSKNNRKNIISDLTHDPSNLKRELEVVIGTFRK